MTGYVLRRASSGDSVIAQASQSALTHTWVVSSAAHPDCTGQPVAPGLHACLARYHTKHPEIKSSTRENNETHGSSGPEVCEAAAGVTQHIVPQQTFHTWRECALRQQ